MEQNPCPQHLHICWGAQAGLYYHYGIEKHLLPQKMFGIFPQKLCDEYNFLTNGFDEIHMTPHSRHTAIDEEQLKRAKELEVLSCSEVSGTNICATADFRQIFILGHLEYGVETLAQEYFRDLNQHKPIQIPVNYFPMMIHPARRCSHGVHMPICFTATGSTMSIR